MSYDWNKVTMKKFNKIKYESHVKYIEKINKMLNKITPKQS